MIARAVLRERIDAHLRQNPEDATIPRLLGTFGLDPRDNEVRAVVEAALDDHHDDVARDSAPPESEAEA